MSMILLSDNGSKQADATLQLRTLADQLSTLTGKAIYPVSLQHADSISADKLNGKSADTFSDFVRNKLEQGEKEFVLLPLFFGNSRALTSFVPDEVTKLKEEYGEFNFILADVIYPLPKGEPLLVDIIYQNILQVAANHNKNIEHVVLVDHGSPVPEITDVRKQVAVDLKKRLSAKAMLSEASMERREGKEYDFNGELLEDELIANAKAGVTEIIVAMMFFLPGRHAGACGDVDEICTRVMNIYPSLNVMISPLISEQSLLSSILENRLNAALLKFNG